MNTNSSLRRFFEDCFVGLIIVLAVFCGLISLQLVIGRNEDHGQLWEFVNSLIFFQKFRWHGNFFLSPLPVVVLAVVISSGISGTWAGEPGTRGRWIRDILFVVVCSWVIGLTLSLIYVVPTNMIFFHEPFRIEDYYFFISFLAPLAGMGALVGFLVGSILGIAFNPHGRWGRVAIVAISSACVAYGVGFGFLILQFFD